MKTDIRWVCALLVLGLLAGCDAGSKSGRGFVFREGDSARGQKSFVAMKCYECHRVDGVDQLPAPTVAPEQVVVLGGKVHQLRTYGQLVTSVIHPTYALSEKMPGATAKQPKDSPMRSFNEEMTVAQMLDIVTFLHPRYQQIEPRYDQYYHGY